MDEDNMILREEIASVQHDIWTNWMEYLFSVSTSNPDGTRTIPADKVARWLRQVDTPYSKLTENEKASDREQADKILNVLKSKRIL